MEADAGCVLPTSVSPWQKVYQRSNLSSDLQRPARRLRHGTFEDGLNGAVTIGTLDAQCGNRDLVEHEISSCFGHTAEEIGGDHRNGYTRCPGGERTRSPRGIDLIGRATSAKVDRRPLSSAAATPLRSDPFRFDGDIGDYARQNTVDEAWVRNARLSKILRTVPLRLFSSDRSINGVRERIWKVVSSAHPQPAPCTCTGGPSL